MSHEGVPQAVETVDRKALLLEQFNEAEAAPQVADTPKPVEVAPASDRPRDEQGKFVPKDGAAVEAAPTQASTPVEEPAWSKAPTSWKPEKRPLWETMTPEAREYAFLREQEMRTGVEPLLPKAKLADEITKAAEPYINTIRGLGIDLPQAVSGLMKVDHDLRTLPYEQKLQTLIQVARSYGVDLTGQAQTAQPSYDPAFGSIRNELLDVKGQIKSWQEQQQAAADRAAQEEIQRFAQKAEYFDEVKPEMAKLLNAGVADTIQDAYEKAVRLHPEIFDKIQSGKQAAAEAEKRKAADLAAKAAKAAAVSVRSATPGTQKPTNAQDRRSMLAEQFSGLSERL